MLRSDFLRIQTPHVTGLKDLEMLRDRLRAQSLEAGELGSYSLTTVQLRPVFFAR